MIENEEASFPLNIFDLLLISTNWKGFSLIDRRVWNRRHVHIYLNWCKVKFDLEELFPETQFGDVDGQTLCTMSWNEFVHRAPFTGDIVYEHLKG